MKRFEFQIIISFCALIFFFTMVSARAEQKDPEAEIGDSQGLVFRGISYLFQGLYYKALTDLNKAIELDPKNALAYGSRGLVYSYQSQPDKAMTNFKKALELDPGLALAYSGRGRIYYDRYQYTEAMDDFNKVIDKRCYVAVRVKKNFGRRSLLDKADQIGVNGLQEITIHSR